MEVAVSFIALQQDGSVYGEDVGCFRPERWIEAGEAERVAMERRVRLVFMSERFQCLGKNLEVGNVVGELVRRFEMSVVDHAGV